MKTLGIVFQFEWIQWTRRPVIYLYAALGFGAAMLSTAGISEAFDPHSLPGPDQLAANAPVRMLEVSLLLMKLLLLVIPAIVGTSVVTDYQSKMHHLLFAYPIRPLAFIAAKFWSSFSWIAVIALLMVLGIELGFHWPGINPALVRAAIPGAGLQLWLVYVLPSVFLVSVLVFAASVYTRNSYAGYVVILLLLLYQGLIGLLGAYPPFSVAAALLEPFGEAITGYQTRYWTSDQLNGQLLPLAGRLGLQRLFWLLAGGVCLWMTFKYFSFHERAEPRQRNTKSDGGNVPAGNLGQAAQTIRLDFSFFSRVVLALRIAQADLSYILGSRIFKAIVLAGIIFIFLQQSQQPLQYGFKLLPTTWQLLRIPVLLFSGVIYLLTFLFAGVLVHRDQMAGMSEMVDSSAVPNWCMLLGKVSAVLFLQLLLLSLIIIGGITTQFYQGFYDVQIGYYLFELYGLQFPRFIPWAFLAVLVQTLFRNYYLGVIALFLIQMGIGALPELGITEPLLQFGVAPGYNYSDLNGYGGTAKPFLYYQAYWIIAGCCFLSLAYLCWNRGLVFSIRERLQLARKRLRGAALWWVLILWLGCIGFGSRLYQLRKGEDIFTANPDKEEQWMADLERTYDHYAQTPQARITAVQLQVDLFPEARSFASKGAYTLVNPHPFPIDTVCVFYHPAHQTTIQLTQQNRQLVRDTFAGFDVFILEDAIPAGDSLRLTFQVHSKKRKIGSSDFPVFNNGTFLRRHHFPGIGYRPLLLQDSFKRAEYGLPVRDFAIPLPADSTAWGDTFATEQEQWIHFEAVIGTSPDQIALAPGTLQKHWTTNSRKYYEYRTDEPIQNNYSIHSGHFAKATAEWKEKQLAVYYHPTHGYNVSRMLNGLQAGLDYCTTEFGAYPHEEINLVEFPKTVGSFATLFGNLIPTSEIRFVADVDDQNKGSIDFPFYTAAHELAHYWWGQQSINAKTTGAQLLTEGLAEYTALRVLERSHGKAKVRSLLEYNLNLYLKEHRFSAGSELPLLIAGPAQDYINYRKGAIVLYALSEQIGEKQFNRALRNFYDATRRQPAPYPTSLDFLAELKNAVPDSLQYLLEDGFETITLCDYSVDEIQQKINPDATFTLTGSISAEKYRMDEYGQREAVTATDWVVLEITAPGEGRTYRQRLKLHGATTPFECRLSFRPSALLLDPGIQYIDTNRENNQRLLPISKLSK